MIDSHHHIWCRDDLPWLAGPEQPRIFGPYASIRRDYLIEEYLEDIGGTGIEKSVYVQANWDAGRYAEEAEWVQSVANRYGWPHGIVGYADFTVDDVRPHLMALSKCPLVCGIRQQFHWHENPQYRFASDPDMARNPVVQRNISHLSELDWPFDLQVFAGQMAGAAALASACPDVIFIIQHAGMLENLSEAGWTLWRTGMNRLAEHENVVVKLSGLGTFLHRVDKEFVSEQFQETVAMFGAERCMFGSNFPIEKIWTGYEDLLAAHRMAAESFSEAERDAIFRGTAERVYKL